VSLIQIKGAYILYTSACIPYINPVDKIFVIYKVCVKWNQFLMASNSWYDLHVFDLGNVTTGITISELKINVGFLLRI
jgi:hypothetical protein